MNPVLILYSSGGGHTARVAHRLADSIAALGVDSRVVDSVEADPGMPLNGYSGLIALSSVRAGKHGGKFTRFIGTNGSRLPTPSIFLSISLTQVTVEDPAADPARKAKAASGVQRLIGEFIRQTGWKPSRALGVAGDLPYTKYGFFLRQFMKWMSKKSGGPTDTSRDYVFTDWAAIDALAREFVSELTAAANHAPLAVS